MYTAIFDFGLFIAEFCFFSRCLSVNNLLHPINKVSWHKKYNHLSIYKYKLPFFKYKISISKS